MPALRLQNNFCHSWAEGPRIQSLFATKAWMLAAFAASMTNKLVWRAEAKAKVRENIAA